MSPIIATEFRLSVGMFDSSVEALGSYWRVSVKYRGSGGAIALSSCLLAAADLLSLGKARTELDLLRRLWTVL